LIRQSDALFGETPGYNASPPDLAGSLEQRTRSGREPGEEIAVSGSQQHHDHDHTEPLDELVLRVKALESLLIEKGLVDPAAIDSLIDTYETKVGPRNGAQVVARAWRDPAFKQRLLEDATAAIASMGYAGRQGEHMKVVENTPTVHNLVVCTLCSCYPWPVLGLPR
jgi:nitrile hydratase subunit alpha